jgi:hypothetical protein
MPERVQTALLAALPSTHERHIHQQSCQTTCEVSTVLKLPHVESYRSQGAATCGGKEALSVAVTFVNIVPHSR